MAKKKRAKAKVKRIKSKTRRPLRSSRAKKGGLKKKSQERAAAKKRKTVLKKAQAVTLEKIGEVTHYFPKVNAAAVLVLKDGLKLGDGVHIKGHTTDFKEKVNSMQLDHAPIEVARKGQEIGLLVKSRVRIGDSVYKL